MESAEYWEKRAIEREKYSRKLADSTIRNKTLRYYVKAKKNLDERIKKIFETFKANGGITEQEAKRLLSLEETQEEIKRLKKELSEIKDPDIRRKSIARINAGAYRARISRLEQIKINIEAQSALLADREKRTLKSLLEKVASDCYYRHIFDTQIGTGFSFDFSCLSEKSITEIINERYSAKTFSQRIWLNTSETAQRAYKIIVRGIMTGSSVPNMGKELTEILNSSEYAAMRLVRTEVNRVHNAADKAAYKEEGTLEYRFLATLDKATCEKCGKMDGKVFKVTSAREGVNFPPLHPNDRCTTVARINKETLEGLRRRARDPQTGKIKLVSASTTYKEWMKNLEITE